MWEARQRRHGRIQCEAGLVITWRWASTASGPVSCGICGAWSWSRRDASGAALLPLARRRAGWLRTIRRRSSQEKPSDALDADDERGAVRVGVLVDMCGRPRYGT